jgi:hypothetical protein
MQTPTDAITVGFITFSYCHQQAGWLCAEYGLVSTPLKAQNLAEKLNQHLHAQYGSQIYVH